MNVTLKPEIAAVLEAKVRAGVYASVEAALEAAVLHLETAEAPELSELDWAKPYLGAAEADFAAGRSLPHDEVWADLEKKFDRG